MGIEQLLHLLSRHGTHVLWIVQVHMREADLLELREHAIKIPVSRPEIRVDSSRQLHSGCSFISPDSTIRPSVVLVTPFVVAYCISKFFKFHHNFLNFVIEFLCVTQMMSHHVTSTSYFLVLSNLKEGALI